MKRVRLVHWRAEEAAPLIENLRQAGYQVDYDARADYHISQAVRAEQPAAVVIDLSRLPSHGREVGTFLRGSKSTRHIPLVFVNGAAEKVEAVRAKLPDAVYTTPARLGPALRQAIAKAPANPVVPAQMMARYAGRTVAQKLGIAAESKVALFDAPKDYARMLGELPAGVLLVEDPRERCAVTLWFVRDPAEYRAGLARMKARAAESKLWILWPKQKAGAPAEIGQQQIRDSAIAVGLVDYKVCAVNETWSALAFAVKK
jgi:CheY-like chemotaxis protein